MKSWKKSYFYPLIGLFYIVWIHNFLRVISEYLRLFQTCWDYSRLTCETTHFTLNAMFKGFRFVLLACKKLQTKVRLQIEHSGKYKQIVFLFYMHFVPLIKG